MIEAYKDAMENYPDRLLAWENFGQAKIVLKVKGEKLIRALHKKAKEMKIPTGLIEDDGLTQVSNGSLTCCAIGPGNTSTYNSYWQPHSKANGFGLKNLNSL